MTTYRRDSELRARADSIAELAEDALAAPSGSIAGEGLEAVYQDALCLLAIADTPGDEDPTELGRLRARLETELASAREIVHRKDEFLAMLAHELRNPLAPLQMAIQLVRRHLKSSPVDRQLDMIERQAANLERIVNDLLEVSRITQGRIELRKQRMDLGEAAARALDAARSVIEEQKHEVSFAVPSNPVFVDADPIRIEQILANLLSNASKYTEPGGHIWISVERMGMFAQLRIRDSGIGMSSDLLAHGFDVFQQGSRDLSRALGGLGLGLSIVKKLTEIHGGTVAASSEGLGKGSEFVVRIPLASALATMVEIHAPEEGTLAIADGPSRRVLVVDDNPDAARALADVLEFLGHEARIAGNGIAALALTDEWHPELVFLDIGLPGMDGYEVARRIRGRGGEVPRLVALTGYGQDSAREKSMEAGFARHLVKPSHLDTIASVLDELGAVT